MLVLAATPTAFGARGWPWLMSGLFALLVIATFRMAEYPDWHRVPRGPNHPRSSQTRWFGLCFVSRKMRAIYSQ